MVGSRAIRMKIAPALWLGRGYLFQLLEFCRNISGSNHPLGTYEQVVDMCSDSH